MQSNPLFLQLQLVMSVNEAFTICIVDAQYACHVVCSVSLPYSPTKSLQHCMFLLGPLAGCSASCVKVFHNPAFMFLSASWYLTIIFISRNICFSFCSSQISVAIMAVGKPSIIIILFPLMTAGLLFSHICCFVYLFR